MEWTKIKPKHFLFSTLSMSNRGCLITLMCLTAHLERLPTEKEMLKVCRRTVLESVTESLRKCDESVTKVLRKVLEDCEKVNHKKAISRSTSETYRNKEKDSDTSLDTTEKRREEKRREDSIKAKRFTPPTQSELTTYLKESTIWIDTNKFVDFYESKGWMVGKNKMKDWKAAVRNWHRSSDQKEKPFVKGKTLPIVNDTLKKMDGWKTDDIYDPAKDGK